MLETLKNYLETALGHVFFSVALVVGELTLEVKRDGISA